MKSIQHYNYYPESAAPNFDSQMLVKAHASANDRKSINTDEANAMQLSH
jgi:hypothetical protein